jgi:outer membrane protein, heavy metal efflux system
MPASPPPSPAGPPSTSPAAQPASGQGAVGVGPVGPLRALPAGEAAASAEVVRGAGELPRLPSLNRVIAIARERAPAVVSARADLNVGRSSYVGARLSPLTNPYLEVFVDRGNMNATKDVAVQANLWLPVELSGQRGRRIEEADALVAWKTQSVEASRASAVGEAVRLYGDVLVNAERVRSFEGVLATARAEAELYEARLKAGDATQQDAKLAVVEVVRNSVALAESRADYARSAAELARVLGQEGFGPPDGASLEPPPIAEGDALSWIDRAIKRSPYLLAYEKEATYYARAKERQSREAHVPVNLIVSAGRGDLGETRLGGGVSWAFPSLRRNQGEQARAEAERSRALAERDVRRRSLVAMLRGLYDERLTVRAAVEEVARTGEPAAQEALDAAVATQRAGKGEFLRVLTARRDLALLRSRRLELARREWSVVGDIVTLTGELP